MLWDQQLGWLLLAWRAQREEIPSDLVEHWRRGNLEPTNAEFAVEEAAAGLADGRLTSVPDLAWLDLGAENPRRIPASSDPHPDLVDRARDGRASPGDWVVLADAIKAGRVSAGTETQVAHLVRVLLDALPRGVGHHHRQLRAAALTLTGVPEFQEPLLTGIRAGMADTQGPAFVEPVGLLASIPIRSARESVIQLLGEPRARDERMYAGWLAAVVLRHGGFDPAQRSRVVMNVLSSWRADPVRTTYELRPLIEELPPGVQETLNRANHLAGRGPGPGADAEVAPEQSVGLVAEVSQQITATIAGQSRYPIAPIAPMLQEMIECSLHVQGSEQCFQMTQMLAASPFRDQLGLSMLDLLSTRGTPPAIRRQAADVVNTLASDSHRLRMLSLINDEDVVVAESIISAFGHIPHSPVSDHAVRQALPVQRLPLGRACLFALGMTGSTALSTLARSRTAPEWQRRGAAWWLAAGPALLAE